MESFIAIAEFVRANPLLIPLLVVWEFYWKGRALWKAARKKELVWFITFLVVNTIGILEIIYLYLINKKQKK